MKVELPSIKLSIVDVFVEISSKYGGMIDSWSRGKCYRSTHPGVRTSNRLHNDCSPRVSFVSIRPCICSRNFYTGIETSDSAHFDLAIAKPNMIIKTN